MRRCQIPVQMGSNSPFRKDRIIHSVAHVLSVPDGCPAHLGRDQFLKSHGDRCYQFVLNRQLTWSGAERDCVLRGGHLASIRGLGEELFLISSLRSLNLAGRGVWIGLNDRDTEGKFVWTSGDYVDFTYWAPGQANEPLRRRSSNDISIKHQPIRVNAQDVQPKSFARRFLFSSHGSETHLLPGLTDGSAEDCVLLKYSDSGHWHDYPCEKLDLLGLVPERFPYVCQYPRTVMTTPTTTQTTKPITNTQVVISTMTLHPPTKGIITGSQRVPTSTKAPYSTLTTTLVTANNSQKMEVSTSEPQSTRSTIKRTTTSSQKVITSTRTQKSTVTTTLPTTATSSTKVITSTTPTPTTLLTTKGTATGSPKIVTSTRPPQSTVTTPTPTTSLKTKWTTTSYSKIVTSTIAQTSTVTTPTPTTLLKTKGTATSSTKVVSSTRAPQSTVTTPTPTTFSTTKLPKPLSPSLASSSYISNKTTATTIEIDNKGGNIASTVTKEQLRGGTETTGTKTSLLSTTWKPIGIIIG